MLFIIGARYTIHERVYIQLNFEETVDSYEINHTQIYHVYFAS